MSGRDSTRPPTTQPDKKLGGAKNRYRTKTSIEQRTRAARNLTGPGSISAAAERADARRNGILPFPEISPEKSDASARSAPLERVRKKLMEFKGRGTRSSQPFRRSRALASRLQLGKTDLVDVDDEEALRLQIAALERRLREKQEAKKRAANGAEEEERDGRNVVEAASGPTDGKVPVETPSYASQQSIPPPSK